jgi:ribosomal protein S12 methylthiotransferase accessory factor
MEIFLKENQIVEVHSRGHVIKTDQPIMAGGDDSAPSPFELFLASIGACAGFYVKAFCKQRGLPYENIKLVQKMHKNEQNMIGTVEIQIIVPSDFPEKYRPLLVKAANACSVKKHIANAPEFLVETVTE